LKFANYYDAHQLLCNRPRYRSSSSARPQLESDRALWTSSAILLHPMGTHLWSKISTAFTGPPLSTEGWLLNSTWRGFSSSNFDYMMWRTFLINCLPLLIQGDCLFQKYDGTESLHSALFLVCLVEIERSETIPQKRTFSSDLEASRSKKPWNPQAPVSLIGSVISTVAHHATTMTSSACPRALP
jgi:hypothetical protein